MSGAAASHDAFLPQLGAGGVQGVLVPSLLSFISTSVAP